MGIAQENDVVGTIKEVEKSTCHLPDTSELKEQNTQPSKNLITENQKMDSAVYSVGFVPIVLAERTVYV